MSNGRGIQHAPWSLGLWERHESPLRLWMHPSARYCPLRRCRLEHGFHSQPLTPRKPRPLGFLVVVLDIAAVGESYFRESASIVIGKSGFTGARGVNLSQSARFVHVVYCAVQAVLGAYQPIGVESIGCLVAWAADRELPETGLIVFHRYIGPIGCCHLFESPARIVTISGLCEWCGDSDRRSTLW